MFFSTINIFLGFKKLSLSNSIFYMFLPTLLYFVLEDFIIIDNYEIASYNLTRPFVLSVIALFILTINNKKQRRLFGTPLLRIVSILMWFLFAIASIVVEKTNDSLLVINFDEYITSTVYTFSVLILIGMINLIDFLSVYYFFRHKMKPYSIYNNPYLWDNRLNKRIYSIEKTIIQQAYEDSFSAAKFLFKIKLTDYNLMTNIRLTVSVTLTILSRSLKIDRLNDWKVLDKLESIYHDVPNEVGEFLPSEKWKILFDNVKDSLSEYRKESSLYTRKRCLESLEDSVKKFEWQNFLEKKIYTEYYKETIDVWKKVIAEEEEKLYLELETEQPLGANIYRAGAPLSEEDKSVFFGREELRQRLKSNILNSQQMPLFFINGQRRTGKSSLISFLPEYLDTGFVVVKYDLQAHAPTNIGQFLESLFNSTAEMLREETIKIDFDLLWVENWKIIRDKLDVLAQTHRKKIILAIDEYEELHRLLQKDTEQAGLFLGAIRGYVQSQNEVIFLFAGADKMTELKNPNWNEYFTQKETLKVEYLNEEDTNKLINAYPSLTYEDEVRKEIFRLTQGYPAMLQILLHKIVEHANFTKEIHIGNQQLQKALEETFYQIDNNVIDIFWSQFCQKRNLRPTVLQILNGEKPTDKKALFQLTQHEFVIEKDGSHILRVPLFEKWLHDYADKVD